MLSRPTNQSTIKPCTLHHQAMHSLAHTFQALYLTVSFSFQDHRWCIAVNSFHDHHILQLLSRPFIVVSGTTLQCHIPATTWSIPSKFCGYVDSTYGSKCTMLGVLILNINVTVNTINVTVNTIKLQVNFVMSFSGPLIVISLQLCPCFN